MYLLIEHPQTVTLLTVVMTATQTRAATAMLTPTRSLPAHLIQRCQMPSGHTHKLCWWGDQQVALGWSSTQSKQGSCWVVIHRVGCSYGMSGPLEAAAAVAAMAAAAVHRQPGCNLCR
jgi:hypothetical protein